MISNVWLLRLLPSYANFGEKARFPFLEAAPYWFLIGRTKNRHVWRVSELASAATHWHNCARHGQLL